MADNSLRCPCLLSSRVNSLRSVIFITEVMPVSSVFNALLMNLAKISLRIWKRFLAVASRLPCSGLPVVQYQSGAPPIFLNVSFKKAIFCGLIVDVNFLPPLFGFATS